MVLLIRSQRGMAERLLAAHADDGVGALLELLGGRPDRALPVALHHPPLRPTGP